METVKFEDLSTADLVVDGIYEGGREGHSGDDPFPRLLSLSNQGGFRYRGNLERNELELLVLTTSLSDPEWPDTLDPETGVFTYFGDNKSPGRALHETPRRGNEILRQIFENAHGGRPGREKVPPILIFANAGTSRDAIFLGLAVPGFQQARAQEDLVAVWKSTKGLRFQNYRARFTVLDAPAISRAWINDIISHVGLTSPAAPAVWRNWVIEGRLSPLRAARSLEYRTKDEQLPRGDGEAAKIAIVRDHFENRPHDFEHCAAAIARMILQNVASIDVTRPSKDGGRDAVGQLRLGDGPGAIHVDFALEAKCYRSNNSVGVREMSRLISRLRHRQFGILVTTSYLDLQAYKEIKEDRHPIIIVAAIDILRILAANGYGDAASIKQWLHVNFPIV